MKNYTIQIGNVVLLALLIGASISCRTLDFAELTPESRNSNLLPAMATEVNVDVLEGYFYGKTTSTTEFISQNESESNSTIIQTIADDRPFSTTSNDFITIFERDVKQNISNPIGKRQGTMVCKIVALNSDMGGMGLAMISACTFGTLNLLGFPFSSNAASVDVEIEVYNKTDELIGSYQAVGRSRVFSALYYGYDPLSASRLSKIRAFKEALDKIKLQINADHDLLIQALKD
ncbi:MAG: hypothetical protein ACERKD_17610 [Prolixibacteraceae bacterium]